MPGEIGSEFARAILEEAHQEADEIIDLARREAERILEDARAELDQAYLKESPQRVTQAAKIRYKQVIAAAELECRKEMLLAQERVIGEVLERIQRRLGQIRQDPAYPDLLRRFILEGVQSLDGESFEIIVASADHPLLTPEWLKSLEQATSKTLTLNAAAPAQITGAIIERSDHRVRSDYSLQGLFNRREQEFRYLISQQLFEESN